MNGPLIIIGIIGSTVGVVWTVMTCYWLLGWKEQLDDKLGEQ